MARKFSDLKNQTLHASDGVIGQTVDILFDDKSWSVRYLVVDTGNWLPGKKVLLTPGSFTITGDAGDEMVSSTLNKHQIENAPDIDADKPVSRQFESTLHKHYGWVPYWSTPFPILQPHREVPAAAVVTQPSYTVGHADWHSLQYDRSTHFDGSLRSLEEICGYKISSSDHKEFGEISDCIIDDDQWHVIDLIMNSNRWLPGGKEFVCSPMFVLDLNEDTKVISLAQKKDSLVTGPDFEFETYGEGYRKNLLEFYQKQQNNSTHQPTG